MSRLFKALAILTLVVFVASSAYALELDGGRNRTSTKGVDLLVRNASPCTLVSGDIVCWASSEDYVTVTIPSHDATAAGKNAEAPISGDWLFAVVVPETISSDDSQGTAADRNDQKNWGMIRIKGVCTAFWEKDCKSCDAGTPVMLAGGTLNKQDPAIASTTDLGGGIIPDACLTSASADAFTNITDADNDGDGMPFGDASGNAASVDVLGGWRKVGFLLQDTTRDTTTQAKVFLT